jgi:hypothetical protein
MTGPVLYRVSEFASTPIGIVEIENHDLLDRVCMIVQTAQFQEYVFYDNFDEKTQTKNIWDYDCPEIQELFTTYVEPNMLSYLPLVADIAEIDKLKYDSFVNKFTKSKTIGYHNHDFALAVSCVYLTDVIGGSLRIFSPLSKAQHGWNDIKTTTSYSFQPKKGSMIIFPGWVSHEVEWYDPSQTRINICTNLGAV